MKKEKRSPRRPAAPSRKASARKAPAPARATEESDPLADRPYLPGYGIPKGKKGLLPWSHVTGKMERAKRYWVATVDPEGRPHATPVDGVWMDGRLYFGGYPTTRRARNLLQNGAACIHLEDAMDVLVLHGEARELRQPSRELIDRLSTMSKAKYGFAAPPELWAASATFEFRPRWVLAWKDFAKDATRWRLA
jgi:hypothetical protein